jgi:hypothetical protein
VIDEAVFTAAGHLFIPSVHARGPWDPDAMHGGAPAALAARALERLDTPGPMRCVRLALEFAGAVPLQPLTVHAALTRPGRRLALAEVAVRADGADVLRGRATLLRVGDVPVPESAQDDEPAVPGPETGRPEHWIGGEEQEGFHLTAIELRFVRGDWGHGPALGWFRLRRPIVAGEEPTPVQRAVAFSDFGNGLSRMLDFRTHLFVNTDLTVHLHREPVGEWIALDARTDLDRTGAGQATSVLRDERGRIGTAAQSLFVDRRG